ncbi:hypothetical protein [Desulfoluna limicola]|uniref:hypothetical protein n=1 Tax=Desulfoluna limicola TaxID=2810562 RepID=UPI001F4643A8|nr:hypothetical protein [Desulfoluna limicola]
MTDLEGVYRPSTVTHLNAGLKTIQLNMIVEKKPPAARCATLKAGFGCALPLVPRDKSHPRLIRALPGNIFNTCLSNFSKVWPPAGPPEACFFHAL